MTDTIFALSSGHGKAGVAVIRISGTLTKDIIARLCHRPVSPRRASLRAIFDPKDGGLIDRGIVLLFPSPGSFTGEDVAELQIHGSIAVIKKLTGVLTSFPNTRPAHAGEFTRRAFDNATLDLLEVEALGDLLDAETEMQRLQAIAGGLHTLSKKWLSVLVGCLAHVEAILDFGDDETPEEIAGFVFSSLDELKCQMEQSVRSARQGELIRNGLTVALAGPPNSGKSSLFNAIAGREAAIIADLPGTTRDVLEVRLDLDGCPVSLFDTAGIRDDGVGVEMEGIKRARARAGNADLVLWVISPDVPNPACDIPGDKLWVIANKDDLKDPPPRPPTIRISTKTGQNIDLLVGLIADFAKKQFIPGAVVARERQKCYLQQCIRFIELAQQNRDHHELCSENIRLSIRSLEALAGKVDVENILARIFSDFCIGK